MPVSRRTAATSLSGSGTKTESRFTPGPDHPDQARIQVVVLEEVVPDHVGVGYDNF